MPNYCYNSLSISGSNETLKKIYNLVHSDDNEIDFEKIIPMPDYIYRGDFGPEEEKIYGKDNWYDWSCEHWGTKWNSVDAHCEWFCDTIEFDFQTACQGEGTRRKDEKILQFYLLRAAAHGTRSPHKI